MRVFINNVVASSRTATARQCRRLLGERRGQRRQAATIDDLGHGRGPNGVLEREESSKSIFYSRRVAKAVMS